MRFTIKNISPKAIVATEWEICPRNAFGDSIANAEDGAECLTMIVDEVTLHSPNESPPSGYRKTPDYRYGEDVYEYYLLGTDRELWRRATTTGAILHGYDTAIAADVRLARAQFADGSGWVAH